MSEKKDHSKDPDLATKKAEVSGTAGRGLTAMLLTGSGILRWSDGTGRGICRAGSP